MFVDEVAGQPLALFHGQPDDLKNIGISISSAIDGSGPRYHPIILIGDDAYVGDNAIALGNGQVVLRDPLPADLPYPPDVVARIADAVSAGRVAIAPARPVPVGSADRPCTTPITWSTASSTVTSSAFSSRDRSSRCS